MTSALANPPAPSVPPTGQPPALSFDDTTIAFENKTDAQMRKAYLMFAAFHRPWIAESGSTLTAWALQARVPLASWVVKQTVFEQFCGGTSIEGCTKVVDTLGAFGVKSILDYSVEGEKTEKGFEATTAETIATLEYAARHPGIAFGVFKVTGLARFALLEKLGENERLSAEEQAEWARVRARVSRICQRAHELGARVLIDAEESWIQDVIDALADEMMALHNRERTVVYNTYQMYRVASLGNLRGALEKARAGGWFVGAKLVRGAYMEKERRRAKERGYPDPIQPDKASTDADYDRALLLCLDHLDRAAICAGTHNEASCMLLAKELTQRGIARHDPRIFFSQLYGMSDNISFNLARAGFNVAKYVPYGPVRSVLPYLIRRAHENSAIAGQGGRELKLIENELRRRKQARGK
jgi:proline dehydrogenase